MPDLRFSREPIVWIGLAVIVFETVKSVLSGEQIGPMAIQNFLILVGTLTGRNLVTPNRTSEEATSKAAMEAVSFERKYHDE